MFTVAELAARVGGEVHGDAHLALKGAATLDAAGPDQLAFFGDPRYRKAFEATAAGAVVVPRLLGRVPGRTVVAVDVPQVAVARLLPLFHPELRPPAGVREGAFVDPSASVDATATVFPGAYVAAGASVGPRSVLHPGAFVGEGAQVGADAILHPNVVIQSRYLIVDMVLLLAGGLI